MNYQNLSIKKYRKEIYISTNLQDQVAAHVAHHQPGSEGGAHTTATTAAAASITTTAATSIMSTPYIKPYLSNVA